MLTTEEYKILMAKREGMRTGIFDTTSLPMHEIDRLVNSRFPIPMKKVPRDAVLSNGDTFRIDADVVWTMPFLATRWSRTDHTLADLHLLGDLAKNPTKLVEDV